MKNYSFIHIGRSNANPKEKEKHKYKYEIQNTGRSIRQEDAEDALESIACNLGHKYKYKYISKPKKKSDTNTNMKYKIRAEAGCTGECIGERSTGHFINTNTNTY